MKLKVKKEVMTGLLVVASLAVLYWGLNFLKGIDLFSNETHYYAVYNKVEGLQVTNPVQINGFTVGNVREVFLKPDNSGKIIVKMTLVDQSFKLPKNTVAKISSLDLLGSKSIDLLLGTSSDFLENGDTLKSSVEASLQEEVNNQILPLKAKAEDLLSSMDTAIQVVRAILNEEARKNLKASFQNFNKATATFNTVTMRVDTMIYEEKMKLSSIMTNFNSISNNLRNNNENITMILDNIAFITDSLAASNITQTINNASIAFKDIAAIMEKIERGEGTIGQLVNNDSLYIHLEKSAKDLDKLLVDLEEHPRRYVHISVFGGKDKETKRREKEAKKKEKAARKEEKNSN